MKKQKFIVVYFCYIISTFDALQGDRVIGESLKGRGSEICGKKYN